MKNKTLPVDGQPPYTTPESRVIELETEDVICSSNETENLEEILGIW